MRRSRGPAWSAALSVAKRRIEDSDPVRLMPPDASGGTDQRHGLRTTSSGAGTLTRTRRAVAKSKLSRGSSVLRSSPWMTSTLIRPRSATSRRAALAASSSAAGARLPLPVRQRASEQGQRSRSRWTKDESVARPRPARPSHACFSSFALVSSPCAQTSAMPTEAVGTWTQLDQARRTQRLAVIEEAAIARNRFHHETRRERPMARLPMRPCPSSLQGGGHPRGRAIS